MSYVIKKQTKLKIGPRQLIIMYYAFKALLRINLMLNVLTTVNNKDPEKRGEKKKTIYPGSPIRIIPQDNQIIDVSHYRSFFSFCFCFANK